MAPPVRKRARVDGDYSWIGTSVQTIDDIKPEHCLRAAGLHGSTPCPLISTGIGPDDKASAGSSSRASSRPHPDAGRESSRSESVELIEDPDDKDWGNGQSSRSNGKNGASKPRVYGKKGKGKTTMSENDKRAAALKQIGCSAIGCRGNPQCYNHLGIHQAIGSKPKEKAMEALGDGPGMREDGGPIGLRNLGNLCYVNALLQVWFHNVQFRNAIYRAHTGNNAKLLGNLVYIFASLQKYNGDHVDPSELVQALDLDKDIQQDAGEFSKLFMEAIRRDLVKQADPAASGLMSRLFEGKMTFTNKCLGCQHVGSREEASLDIQLSLKDGDTLQDRLNALQSIEHMVGENQYRCSRCDKLNDADRCQSITELPEVIHFSLLRFTFNPKTGERKKSKAAIIYPKQTIFGGVKYDLRAVVSHIGSSGHYVSAVYDETSKTWLHCSDETVSPLPESKPTAKIPQGYEQSRDAYMLVYARNRDQEEAPIEPPQAAMDAVEAQNTVLRGVWEEWREKCQITALEQEDLRKYKETVARALVGNDHIVSRDALAKWFTATDEELPLPISYEDIVCSHSTDDVPTVDPAEGRSAKTISQAAFDLIAGRTPIRPATICQTCVAAKFAEHKAAEDRSEQVRTFGDLNLGDRVMVISDQWLEEWKSGKLDPGVLPTSNGYSLYCAHEQPYVGERAYTKITVEALALLHSALGDFDTYDEKAVQCVKCEADKQADGDMQIKWKDAVRQERKLQSAIDARPVVFGDDYYAVSDTWYDAWKEYKQHPGPKPKYKADICEHGGLPFDPRVERVHHLNELGWRILQDFYGPQTPVVIRLGSNPLPGALTEVTSFKPDICVDCCQARALDWEGTDVHIQQGGKRTAGTRSRGKDIAIEVTQETTIKELRVEILKITKISPLSQELTFEGRVLDKAEQTMRDVGMTRNGRIALKEIIELDDLDEGGRGREGFHGTALMGYGGDDNASPASAAKGDNGAETKNRKNATNDTTGMIKQTTNGNNESDDAAAASMAADEAFARQLAAQTNGSDGNDDNADMGGAMTVACTMCTFLNPAAVANCDMCGCEL